MAFTLTDAVAAVQAIARALGGVRAAPENPTETANAFPFAITYPLRVGATPVTGSQTRRLNTLVTEIHCARLLLPAAVAQATVFGDTFPAAIWADPTLGGACNHVNEVRGEFVAMVYGGSTGAGGVGGLPTIGWRFELDLKQEN